MSPAWNRHSCDERFDKAVNSLATRCTGDDSDLNWSSSCAHAGNAVSAQTTRMKATEKTVRPKARECRVWRIRSDTKGSPSPAWLNSRLDYCTLRGRPVRDWDMSQVRRIM